MSDHGDVTPPEDRSRLLEQRVETVRRLTSERGRAGALLGTRRNFAWLTIGGSNHVVLASETGVAPLLIAPDRVLLLAPVNEAARIEDEELGGLGMEIEVLPWFQGDAAAARAVEILGEAPLVDADLEQELVGERSRLGSVEHSRLRILGRQVSELLGSVSGSLAPGSSEAEAAGAVLGGLGLLGLRSPVILVAADDRIARYRHPLPAEAAAQERIMLVLVAERWGLHVAATRFRHFLEPDADLGDRFEAVRAVQAALHDATRPGSTLGAVLAAGRRAYQATGFTEEWTLHHQGGTIGYQGRERIAVPDDATPIEAGMAFAWNPSISGAKVEETLLLGENGRPEIVTA